jgi:2-polyprenyl-3-methyl-5-hydroxy-6-metoxy-1,4-benzoquinol methylase
MNMSLRHRHWEKVYQSKSPEQTSWYQSHPEVSLELIVSHLTDHEAAILDVGGGASTLAGHLLEIGYTDISVLDIAEAGLAHARKRLGTHAGRVHWITSDVITWEPKRQYDLWHDRAVLHFLTDSESQTAYFNVLRGTVKLDGITIIAGFAPGGPERCSDLSIVQHDQSSLSALLGEGFRLIETRDEIHSTPKGGKQAFRYHVFRRM